MTDDWSALIEFASKWFVEPLERAPLDASALEAAHARCGPLPSLLCEWFELVGDRLQPVQDSPVPLQELRPAEDDASWLPLWWENQGVWSVDADLRGGAMVAVRWDGDVRQLATLESALLSMVVSDTLMGAAHGEPGPLGALHADVRGRVFVAPRQPDAHESLPALELPPYPLCGQPYRSNGDLVVRRWDDGVIDWMARTAEAEAQALALFGTEPAY